MDVDVMDMDGHPARDKSNPVALGAAGQGLGLDPPRGAEAEGLGEKT